MIFKGQSVLGRGLIFSKGKELRFTNIISKLNSLNKSGVKTSYSRVRKCDILICVTFRGKGEVRKRELFLRYIS